MKKELILFYLKSCPYCIKAMKYLQELQNEKPEYASMQIKMVEERAEKELADSYDYYFVPTFFLGAEKLHEGAASKDDIEKVLQKAVEQ